MEPDCRQIIRRKKLTLRRQTDTIRRQEETIQRQAQIILRQQARTAELEQTAARLTARVEELTAQVARLSKNSSNSSRPPFSDITKPPQPPGHGHIGSQPGHPRHQRPPFDAGQIDRTCRYELSPKKVRRRRRGSRQCLPSTDASPTPFYGAPDP